MKKIVSFMLVACSVLFLLCGCNEKPNGIYLSQTPEYIKPPDPNSKSNYYSLRFNYIYDQSETFETKDLAYRVYLDDREMDYHCLYFKTSLYINGHKLSAYSSHPEPSFIVPNDSFLLECNVDEGVEKIRKNLTIQFLRAGSDSSDEYVIAENTFVYPSLIEMAE